MAILDLLASITGEQPTQAPNAVSRPTPILGKRKADDGLKPAGAKAARVDATSDKPARPNGDSAKPSPRPAERQPSVPGDKQPSNPRPAPDRSSLNGKHSAATAKVLTVSKPSTNGNKPLPSRPTVSRPSPTDSGPPKKRSYAEIMARAKANSEMRESLGKIQHKTVERTLTLKERKELKAEEARKARVEARRAGAARPGAVSGSLRDVAKSPAVRSGASSGSAVSKKTAPEEPKKVKKAALATTGYTGTARPRPGTSATAKPGSASRPSADARPRDKPRYGGPLSSSRKRYEEDDDLDDFIVDDEEEEEQGYGNPGRYQYYSDEEESDMEAGISDIEDEEQRAERQARREDMEQEALERRLKQEKEERRRRFLEATKAKAGGR